MSSPSETEANRRLALDFVAAIARGDTDAILSIYAADGVCRISGNTLISGTLTREQVAAACKGIFEAFPEGLQFEVLGVTAEGDRVAIEAESAGRHVSGAWYSNQYHFLARFRDAQLIEWKEYMDTEKVTDILCGGQRPSTEPEGS